MSNDQHRPFEPDAARRRWLIACHGKQAFDSSALAHKVNRRPSKVGGPRRQVYKCKGCGKWHLGTPSRPYKRRIKDHVEVDDEG